MIRHLGVSTVLLFAVAALFSQAAFADTRYVTDELIISLREGKGSEFPAVKTLRSGMQVEFLEEDGQYMKVRTADGAEGWLLSRYITAEPPKAMARERASKELQDVTDKYNALLEQSKHVTEVSDELGRLKAENDRIKALHEELRVENESLKRKEKVNWFLAGGGVFFVGWIIGKISRQKRRY